jgi:hypothetical protein
MPGKLAGENVSAVLATEVRDSVMSQAVRGESV